MDRLFATIGTVLLLLLCACGARFGVYNEHGMFFHYPSEWRDVDVRPLGTSVSDPLTRDVIGIDQENFVIVSTYRVNVPITEENFPEYREQIAEEWVLAIENGGAELVEAPTSVTMGGLPALRFEAVEGIDARGPRSIIVLAFRDTTEFFLNCQHTPEWAHEIERGCEQIVRTFQPA